MSEATALRTSYRDTGRFLELTGSCVAGFSFVWLLMLAVVPVHFAHQSWICSITLVVGAMVGLVGYAIRRAAEHKNAQSVLRQITRKMR